MDVCQRIQTDFGDLDAVPEVETIKVFKRCQCLQTGVGNSTARLEVKLLKARASLC